jgi:1,4-alpha-glucan branching enzyme
MVAESVFSVIIFIRIGSVKEVSMVHSVPENILSRVIHFDYYDPFHILGIHTVDLDGKKAIAVRTINPAAKRAWVVIHGVKPEAASSGETVKSSKSKARQKTVEERIEMNRIHYDGFFEALFTGKSEVFDYEIAYEYDGGYVHAAKDPYSFLPVLSGFDLHLFSEGSHQELYDKLGAHLIEMNKVKGVHFAVWAPNAKAVSVIGDFNAWDNRRHQMRVLGSSGVWEIFIPGLGEGETYKFCIKTQSNHILEKADPYGFFSELRPKTGSRVWDINKYKWNDSEWLRKRQESQNLHKPISIYEVHLGSWKRGENNSFVGYRKLADELVEYVNYMGYTHIELMPVAEHPFDGSWGYQVTGYYAPTSRFGEPEDFMYFVDKLHQNNIGIILDWVPGHFPKDAHGLANFDGTSLYEHSDPRKGEHMDWGTKIFNYGRNEVRNFLTSNALFWIGKYHIDGLRVDAVASMLYLDYSRKAGEWVPNQFGGRENLEAIDFMKRMNELVYSKFPGTTTIAEESTAWGGVSRPTYVGGLGFEFKWNMGWMNDTLVYFEKDPVYRKYHQGTITFSLIYAFSENFVLVLSHDEVVHGKGSIVNKMPGDMWQKFANTRLLYTYMWTHPGKKLLFQGQDFGQWDEWKESGSIDWHLCQWDPHNRLQKMISDLNRIYRSEPALYEVDFESSGFEWLDLNDSDNCILSYIRRAKNGDYVVVALNFTPVPRNDYRIGAIFEGYYMEIFNSDSSEYWGANVGNNGGVWTDPIPWQGKGCSIRITIPPLGGVIFKLKK